MLQTVLAGRIARAAWRLERAERLEVELFEERHIPTGTRGLALIRDGNSTRSFETLLRYRGAALAELWRALRTLKALQAEARAHAAAGAEAPAPVRPAALVPASAVPRSVQPAARAQRPDEPESRTYLCESGQLSPRSNPSGAPRGRDPGPGGVRPSLLPTPGSTTLREPPIEPEQVRNYNGLIRSTPK